MFQRGAGCRMIDANTVEMRTLHPPGQSFLDVSFPARVVGEAFTRPEYVGGVRKTPKVIPTGAEVCSWYAEAIRLGPSSHDLPHRFDW